MAMSMDAFGRHLERFRRALVWRLALLHPRGVDLLPAAQAPMPRHEYAGDGSGQDLIICLPGIGDVGLDFEAHGFVEAAKRGVPGSDLLAVDAHLGYYLRGEFHERLTQDVIEPGRRGYQRLWLAGISLGGFGALSYAERHLGQIDGLILFAPYLGEPTLVGEIARAGGLAHWEPGEVAPGDHGRRVWRWLKQERASAPPRLPIYLGYGARDKFAPAHRLLAKVLSPEQVFMMPGGHDWLTWKQLWLEMLRRGVVNPLA